MQAFAVILAIVATASATPQFINGLGLGYSGLGYGYAGYPYAQGLAYNAAVTPVAIAHGVTKTQYHAQDEFGQASFGHSQPDQAHTAVRDAAGGVRGTFSYISPEGKQLTTHYVADHNGYRVASNALPVGPAPVILAGPAPVQDTPEVVSAKIAHAHAHAEALARSGRKKRAIVSPFGYSYGIPSAYGYSTGFSHYAGAPALTYAASPALTYAAAPVHYSAVSHIAAPAAVTYAASPVIATQALREATLTKVVNTPGHAVSYRVD